MIWSKKLTLNRSTKVWARPFLVLAALVMLFSFQTACQSEARKSVLILAFDQLDNEQLDCLDERSEENSGFAIICKEFIRFTHAYTPSLQPAAALASILSGQYPITHEVHRSFDTFNHSWTTVQEAAHLRGYRTSFFAGNPHFLKKTGFSNYFEVFDDSAAAQYSNHIIKDFKIVSESFLSWVNEDDEPFFSVLTNSEIDALNESNTATTNLEKIDEKLYTFINELKNRGIWDKTYVYVLGLKGSNNYNRLNETSFLNLHSENTQVALLIKTPRMQGDEGISWKNDLPITLADVGYSLKKFFNIEQPSALDTWTKDFSLIDLNQLLKERNPSLSVNRNILIETANSWSKTVLELNFAILTDTHLVIERKDQTQIFNLVTDRFEVVDIFDSENKNLVRSSLRGKYPQAIDLNLLLDLQLAQSELAKNYLKNALPLADFFKEPVSENSPLFIYWLNLQIKSNVVNSSKLEKLNAPFKNCFKVFEQIPKGPSDLKKCQDSLFTDFLKFKYAGQLGLNPESMQLNYEVSRKKYFEEVKIAIWNLAYENIWGLYNPHKIWFHPLVILDPKFI